MNNLCTYILRLIYVWWFIIRLLKIYVFENMIEQINEKIHQF